MYISTSWRWRYCCCYLCTTPTTGAAHCIFLLWSGFFPVWKRFWHLVSLFLNKFVTFKVLIPLKIAVAIPYRASWNIFENFIDVPHTTRLCWLGACYAWAIYASMQLCNGLCLKNVRVTLGTLPHRKKTTLCDKTSTSLSLFIWYLSFVLGGCLWSNQYPATYSFSFYRRIRLGGARTNVGHRGRCGVVQYRWGWTRHVWSLYICMGAA